jgi:hypothetical protein
MAAQKDFQFAAYTPDGEEQWRFLFKKMRSYLALTERFKKRVTLDPRQDNKSKVAWIIHEAGHIVSGIGPDPRFEQILDEFAATAVAMLDGAKLIRPDDEED